MVRSKYLFLGIALMSLLLAGICWAEKEDLKTVNPNPTATNAVITTDPTPEVTTTTSTVSTETTTTAPVVAVTQATSEKPTVLIKADTQYYADPSHYTLGPEDVIQVDVQRHPEFSGVFPVNMEGRIQLKFAGDIEVTGLNKVELQQKIKKAISNYVINPDVTVTIMDYKSKVIYVLGEVGSPGKFYMQAETIPVREALVQAGLPTLSAAMRRCRLITPDKTGKAKIKDVDVYSLLYGGDLTKNLDMHAGDVLYVPATVMAKIVQVINPVTSAVGVSSTGPTSADGARSAVTNMSKKAVVAP